MNLSNPQAAVSGLVASIITLAVSLGLISGQEAKGLIGAAGIIVPAVFVLVVAIENHANTKATKPPTPAAPAAPVAVAPVVAAVPPPAAVGPQVVS